jgi:hypothetical protein
MKDLSRMPNAEVTRMNIHDVELCLMEGAQLQLGDNYAGIIQDRGKVTVGKKGIALAGRHSTAISGELGVSLAEGGGLAICGAGGLATVGKNGLACAGPGGIASAGIGATVKADVGGELHTRYWDEASQRFRTKIAYVGEDGILPNRCYRLNERCEYVEVEVPELSIA